MISRNNCIEIDRPVHSHKKFTFYRSDNLSINKTGIIPGNHNNGLVEITFIPEKSEFMRYNMSFDSDLRNSSYRECGTDLSKHSSQQFITGPSLNLDHNKQIILSYRLVGMQQTPNNYDDIEQIYNRQRPPLQVFEENTKTIYDRFNSPVIIKDYYDNDLANNNFKYGIKPVIKDYYDI
jgi:hypothetical protein